MAGGKNNITGKDGKQFSSTYQPKNRRKSTKFLTDMLTKKLKGKQEVVIEGVDVTTGQQTQIVVTSPTKEVIAMALLKKAAKGNINAIREVFDRVEGKAKQDVGISFNYDQMSESDLDFIIDHLLNKAQ